MFELEGPDVIGGARVVAYAVVNLSLPNRSKERFVNGKFPETAYGLAICEYKAAEGYYLFRCDDRWIEFSDTWHETVEDAKDQAEYEYVGIGNNWNFK